jgi:hypothetical protein
MRTAIVGLLSASAVLCGGRCAWAQAGRFVPRVIPGGGGGGGHLPHVPIHFFGQDSDLGTLIVLVVALAVLACVGHWLGYALGEGGKQQSTSAPRDVGLTGASTGAVSARVGPDERDLILSPAEVAVKAAQTTRLMEFLAHQDPQLNPANLRQTVAATFSLVQQCWEARDYGPVSDLLRPGILAEHQKLLRQMREGREINRIQGLRVEAVDFVHLFCLEDLDGSWWEVAALITFEAAVYFVNDSDGALTRGSRSPGLFQEFWVFRRQGQRWLLDRIERTHESVLLEAANHVAGLSGEELQNLQHSIAL